MLKRFGANIYGRANYRVIWSEDRLEPDGPGKWRRRYGNGRNRWMVERWMPPSAYGTRDEWDRQLDQYGERILGPYPTEGDYEWCYTFDAAGEAVPLEPELLNLLCRCIERSRLITPEQTRQAIQTRLERERNAQEQLVSDVWDEAQGPFGGNQVAGIPSKRTAEDVRVDVTADKLPAGFGTGAGFRQVPAAAAKQVLEQ